MEGCAITPQAQLAALGFKVTYSGPTPNATWGKHWIHASKLDAEGKMQGAVYGYGADEESAIANAVQTLEAHK